MRLADHLTVDGITTDLSPDSKDETLRSLARLIAPDDGELSEEDAYRVLAERERLATTGVGSGVAVPHGRADVEEFTIGLGICKDGCEFGALDGELTRIFVAVLAPEGRPAGQLKMLAKISQLLRDPAIRERLLAAPNREAVLQVLLDGDEDR